MTGANPNTGWLDGCMVLSFLLIARTIQGVGLSMFPIAFGIIRSQFPPQKLAGAQGIYISTFAGGSAVGLAVGGPIVNYLGWHATFFSILPIAVALIVCTFIFREKRRNDSRDDLSGATAL